MNNSNSFNTGKSPEIAKNEYANMVFRIIEKFAESMTEMSSIGDVRVRMYTEFLISMIVDEEIRNKLLEERKQELARTQYDGKNREIKSQSHSDVLSYHINMRYFGKCVTQFDKWIGIIHRQEVFSEE